MELNEVFIGKKEIHPVADIFPPMSETEFNNLCESIEQNGQREAIWLFDNKIIDGRNRYKACEKIGVTPHYAEFKGDESELLAFVIDINLHRRHLSESQRAMVAANIANLPNGTNRFSVAPQICGATTQTAAAEMVNVSTRSVTNAKKVQEHGSPELIDAVNKGEISVSTAVVLADLPKAEQTAIVEQGKVELQERAKELREERFGGDVTEIELRELDNDSNDISIESNEITTDEAAKFEPRRWRVWINNLKRTQSILNSFQGGGLERILNEWEPNKQKMVLRFIKKIESQIIPIKEALQKSLNN